MLLISKIMESADGILVVLVRPALDVAFLGLDDVVLDDVGHFVVAVQFWLVIGPRSRLYLPPLDIVVGFALRGIGAVGNIGADLRLFSDVMAHGPALLLHLLGALLRFLPAEVRLRRVLYVECADVVSLEGCSLELYPFLVQVLSFLVERSHRLHFLLLVRLFLSCFLLDPKRVLFLLIDLFRQRCLRLCFLQLLGVLFFFGVVRAECQIFVQSLHELDEFCDCLRAFGIQVLALFHVPHLMVQLDDEIGELFVIGGLVLVELDNSFLEYVEE